MSCDEVRDLAPEIALGTIDGEERAEALRHLATCAECRRLVDQLSEVADELLMLAPVEEPSLGFESRVVEALRCSGALGGASRGASCGASGRRWPQPR